MAESAKIRKQLDEDQKKTYDLLSGKDYRKDVFRGATASDNPQEFYGSAFDSDNGAYGKNAARSEQKLPEATEKDLGLMVLTSKMDDPKQFFNQVAESVASFENCDLTVLDWNIIGNKYSLGKHVEYLLAFYAVGEETKIDCKRMSGGGFVHAAFFSEIKDQLKKNDLIEAVDEDPVDFEYEDDSDDSGEDDENLSNGFLQLAYDPKIVQAWIQKVQTRHVEDQIHIVGLMAYNASNKQNLDIIVEQGGKKLKDLFIHKFENSNIAVLVQFASELAKHVTGHPDSKNHGYDEDFLVAIFDAMKHWVPGKKISSFSEKNRQQSTKFDITESRETVKNLVQTIYNLGETTKIFPAETIISLAKSSLEKKYRKEGPKDAILRFLEKQEDSMPNKYFRHILKQIE